MTKTWDCIIVGGGAAGLSAALVLGRARRRTLLLDAGGQSNRPAHGIGGLLGADGRPPADYYAAGRAELAAYPAVELRDGEVVRGERIAAGDGRFTLELADGTRESARRVLLATGMDYRYPQLDGIAERWGRSVFHCPFCHGWEVRERPLAVLDRGAGAVHRATLLRAWSDDVTVLANGPAELSDEEAALLRAAGVTVDERPVAGLVGPGEELTAVRFADGAERPCGGLLVPVTLHQRSPLAEQLGAATHAANPLTADAVEVDAQYNATVPGLHSAGDAAGVMPSVANAVAAGNFAAAMLVAGLMADRFSG
ncbi:NAD(P)/FAD-dependent oxidoreductase [Conexibacter stalactiti]|uniref:NAD(P)/FAD-dependent oxidoreductase n=1 Tax=Conexibacter stalactiti TaxID=1940611 RepID=A0ABU4HVI9_9ACTN|nr:NAD(P)/FAD-dependent oxidoreductase [Conexibacter stalactiti]MDW5597238.1 NAD(P)/FAD-dependent oxidoreductase [Conexibacter stalactiti]MEC5037880.1 NAD(P)/FAD-dependent oxidoreductase [Conexibacter stalactiti]